MSQRPAEALAALLAYCDVRFSPERLADVIARDSQEGTAISRATAQEPDSDLTEERRARFFKHLAELAPGLSPDVLLPGTFGA
jgi:hypothetical protein